MNDKLKIPVAQVNVQPAANILNSKSNKPFVPLSRDVPAIRVPDGGIILLTEGMQVKVTQALGSTFTVEVAGNLFRIDGDEGDAFNEDPRPTLPESLLTESLTEEIVINILKTCFDPEIPVNLYDLGLIYQIELSQDAEQSEQQQVSITMTLTSPACGMGEVLTNEVQKKIAKHPDVSKVKIEIVFDPPWDKSMLSMSAKLELGLI